MTIADIGWRGPRPLSFQQEGKDEVLRRLVGRKRQLDELTVACQTYAVVEITAPSGVGKTSFVAGAKPYLEAAGAKVEKARPWSETLQRHENFQNASGAVPDALALYYLAFGVEPASGASAATLLEQLADGQQLVCVVDQLEELLRYHAPLGREFLRLVGRTAGATGVTHVVIARSEFRDELRPVEEARNAPTWHLPLREISDPDLIRDIIKRPVPEDVTIEEAAVERLVEWWVDGRSSTTEFRDSEGVQQPTFGDVGLLHLHAMLWSLKRWATSTASVDERLLRFVDLEEFARFHRVEPGPESGAALMSSAMLGYVQSTIEGCSSARWPIGPRIMVARAARHLSSAGYKVPQAASSLVPLAMQEELASSREGRELSRQLRATGADSTSRVAVAKAFPIEGAGAAVAWEGWEVTLEMMDSLAIGLERLADETEANVLRRFQHGGDPVYELVHDGVGAALNRWAERLLDDPISLISVISAQRGQVMSHNLTADTFAARAEQRDLWGIVSVEQSEACEIATIEGLKWYGLGVHLPAPFENPERLRLERLVFRDCDFQGTVFINVALRDVTFEGCNLRGVAMLGCTFDGVRFDGSGQSSSIDSLAIGRVQEGADVEFRNIRQGTGLFLTDLSGGSWTFDDVRVEHFVLRSVDQQPLRLRMSGNTSIRHATFDAPRSTTVFECGDGIVIEPLTDVNGILD